ncbi:uncharacterized protein BKA55DRAFT_716394 [Fusarium redolens]|uniref:Uncharacterized protein n=1 Tax=Fusarium redolens TaxID=48865 RepID=A0A9P9G1Q2_FUSRE|nr:uncharacterized protein BKA55DRAFT_716394 [Fusarium redolens]KAH7228546.1 hypothetical protein BKA55DRAFT_716394 [Fusarium redolens]
MTPAQDGFVSSTRGTLELHLVIIEILQEVKQLHPKLEYSAVNKLRSIKLEVIDCTLTQPRFARIYSSHVKGSLRRWDDLIDWIRLDLPKANVEGTQKILLTGLSSRPNIHELNHWMRSRLGSDCLLIVASRIARIGMCRALVFVCTLAMVKGLSEDRIHDGLEGAMFGNETVRILVERSDGQASATKCQQEAAPLVVLGSSRLPPQWPMCRNLMSGVRAKPFQIPKYSSEDAGTSWKREQTRLPRYLGRGNLSGGRLYCKITSPFNSTTKKLYRLSYSYACVFRTHCQQFYRLQDKAEKLYTMTAPHFPIQAGTHQPGPLSIQNMVKPVENQGISSYSNTMPQQYGLIPAASMYVSPAVLQSMDVPSEKSLHPKSETWQKVMTGQGQHNQEHQEPRPFMPAPIRESDMPTSASAWIRNTKHRRLKPGYAPATFGQQRSRACHGQLQMMSTWRFQDHQGNQPQGGLSTHSVKHRVTRAMASRRSGAPRSPGAQTRNVETDCHAEWLQRPLVRRVPSALQPRLPSIRSLIPELPETFANQTEVFDSTSKFV